MPTPYPIRRVTPEELRQIFNENLFWERVQAGEFREVILDQRPASTEYGQPPNTLSQSLSYRDGDDREMARVHRFLREDGSIGGSGRPDPKRVLYNGTLYRLHKGQQGAVDRPIQDVNR